MARFEGESPFQNRGFVWSGQGHVLAPSGAVRLLFDKPVFSFEYDALFAEPTLCHRVYLDEEYPLDELQQIEVFAFIDAELAIPAIVNGVDADGKYLSGVPETEVTRVVHNPPPDDGTWRFDFVKAAQLPGDHWVQAICIDEDGRYIGNVPEGEFTAIASDLPPPVTEGEDWRWVDGEWADVRPLQDRVAAARERRTDDAWAESAGRFAASVVTVEVGGQLRSYGCDPYTRENILAINGVIGRAPQLVPNPRPYTPKGETVPVDTTHDEFLAIYLAGLAAGDAYYNAYKTHKDAINALEDVEAIRAYDVTTGWPT